MCSNCDFIMVFPTANLHILKSLTEQFLHYGSDGSLASKRRAYAILHHIWGLEPFTAVAILPHLIGRSRTIADFVRSLKAPA